MPCPTCSTGSSASIPRAPGSPTEPALAWPSCDRYAARRVAKWRSPVPWTAAATSRSGSRLPMTTQPPCRMDTSTPNSEKAAMTGGRRGAETAVPRGRAWGWIIVAIAMAAVAAVPLLRHSFAAAAAGVAESVSTVAVAPVVRRDLYRELRIQAEFRPYLEVELHAKVAGYLKSITVDFGDRVKAGDTIATIEVPELGEELDHALAAEQRAEADYRDAHLDYTRLSEVIKGEPNLVAQQDLDTAQARDAGAEASVTGAKADVARYRTLLGYTRITAPFDGVVTARYA